MNPDSTSVATAFTYDLQGRLESATTENFTAGTLVSRVKAAYDYDTTGIRSHAFDYTDTVLDPNTENWTLNTETQFLVDHQNHTGYQQVLRETQFTDGVKSKTVDYSFGHDELTQTTGDFDAAGNVTSDVTLVFGHDGHGSVRILTDMAAAITQLFLYDAYGQMLAIFNGAGILQSGGNGSYADASLAATILLYSGEQFDSRIGQQYLRARYYDATTGMFNRLDPFFGNLRDPQSFHKYLYTHGDPVNGIDPTGMFNAISVGVTGAIIGGLAGGYLAAVTGRSILGGVLIGAAVGATAFLGVGYAASSISLFAGGGLGGLLTVANAGVSVGAVVYALQRMAYQAAVSDQQGDAPSAAEARNDYNYALLSLDVYDGDRHNTEGRLASTHAQ